MTGQGDGIRSAALRRPSGALLHFSIICGAVAVPLCFSAVLGGSKNNSWAEIAGVVTSCEAVFDSGLPAGHVALVATKKPGLLRVPVPDRCCRVGTAIQRRAWGSLFICDEVRVPSADVAGFRTTAIFACAMLLASMVFLALHIRLRTTRSAA